jgi:hypothetical protein
MKDEIQFDRRSGGLGIGGACQAALVDTATREWEAPLAKHTSKRAPDLRAGLTRALESALSREELSRVAAGALLAQSSGHQGREHQHHRAPWTGRMQES